MRRNLLFLAFLLCVASTVASAQQTAQVPIPLDLDAQLKIIPPLCDHAIYSARRQFLEFCTEMIEKLRAAKEKADKAKPDQEAK